LRKADFSDGASIPWITTAVLKKNKAIACVQTGKALQDTL